MWPFSSTDNSFQLTVDQKLAQRDRALKAAPQEELSFEETQIVGSTGNATIKFAFLSTTETLKQPKTS